MLTVLIVDVPKGTPHEDQRPQLKQEDNSKNHYVLKKKIVLAIPLGDQFLQNHFCSGSVLYERSMPTEFQGCRSMRTKTRIM
ncbi:UNVERIFIED_CONTAM: hypothetical protein NCL1_57462 [Trichonephila clavipes]